MFTALIASVILGYSATPIDWKTVDYSGVDWKTVDYGVDWKTVDYSGIDWKTVNYDVDWKTVNYGGQPTTLATLTSGIATTVPTVTSASSTTVPTTSAVPTSSLGNAFTLISIRSGSNLQYLPIYAKGYTLQLGGQNPNSYTPSGIPVPVSNVTTYQQSGDRMNLRVVVPGGEGIYVAQDGKVKYTVPHSGQTNGGTVTGFGITDSDLTFNGKQQFLACPNGDGTYDLTVAEKSSRTDCQGIAVRATSTDAAPAWQW